MKPKKEKTLRERIIEVLEDFQLGYTPNSGRNGMRHWRDKMMGIIYQEKKKVWRIMKDKN